MGELGRVLLIVAAVLGVAGLFLVGMERFPAVADLLRRFPLGRLPGDIFVDRPGFRFYFPVTTGILISLVVSLLLYFFRK